MFIKTDLWREGDCARDLFVVVVAIFLLPILAID